MEKEIEVSKNEYNLIQYIRTFGYGELTITINNGEPIMGERGIKKVHFAKGFDENSKDVV